MEYLVLEGDTLATLNEMDENSVDSVVTDPPYGLKFMGKKWDYDVPTVEVWKAAYRVLKPGGHMLVACGTRTQHRMVVNIEDAGFEIRDVITWHYGSGFPKSHDISKAIDNQAGVEREVIGSKITKDIRRNVKEDNFGGQPKFGTGAETKYMEHKITAPGSDEAKKWAGWGTALKPATEFWTLCRKPLSEDTVAANVLKYGTGGINIDATRIIKQEGDRTEYGRDNELDYKTTNVAYGKFNTTPAYTPDEQGRFPANLILDEFMGAEMDKQSGISKSTGGSGEKSMGALGKSKYGKYALDVKAENAGGLGDSGGASRFFYCAKASKSERNAGLDKLNLEKEIGHNRFDKCTECGGTILQNPDRPSACKCESPVRADNKVKGNFHPTVKPIKLMQYLVKLITPPGGMCLDLFNGSGTTGCACAIENINYLGIDREADYVKISEARIEYWKNKSEAA